ncbi:MAG: DUF4293 domain-containing protein [Bacteroidota bacterium]|nr:DUF4293 domain-containing protein [Bacteroidota bacterium]
MIQRIQSIWLLFAAACAFLTYKFSFYSGMKTGSDNIQRFTYLNASTEILLMIIAGFLGLACFITIFLFKDRKLQFRITIICLLLSALNLIIYFVQIKKFTTGNFLLTSIFSFIIPLFLIFAARGIWKDEKLIKSLDRLR